MVALLTALLISQTLAAEMPSALTVTSRMQQELKLTGAQRARVEQIIAKSPGKWMGQGNPKVTQHEKYAMSRDACWEKSRKFGEPFKNARNEQICGAPYMAPLYDRTKGQRPEDATACMDLFEFPNLPCDYPFVWVTAFEAAQLCEAVGKRLCDAYEWEGGCDGEIDEDFRVGDVANGDRKIQWGYGDQAHALKYPKKTCAMDSVKDGGCQSTWEACGSNTYPAGSFPECRGPLGFFDIHGNAAEHMNLARKTSELTSRGATTQTGMGVTEMKGSWFIFDKYVAHKDDCHWREPGWHRTGIVPKGHGDNTHRNYHLGFRCCKNTK